MKKLIWVLPIFIILSAVYCYFPAIRENFVEPFDKFFVTSDNILPKWRATWLSRPRTASHPFYKDGKPAHL